MVEFHFDAQNGNLLIDAGITTARTRMLVPDLLPPPTPLANTNSPESAIIPLTSLLETQEFPYATGDYNLLNTEHWDRADYITYGKWVLHVVNGTVGQPRAKMQQPPEQTVTYRHLRRLYILGLAPGTTRIENRFDNLTSYKKAIGAPVQFDRVSYADWGLADFTSYARKLEKHLGRKPIDADYQEAFSQGKGPDYQRIYKYVGGVSVLNELIGHPNFRQWQQEDFIAWGAKVIRANNGIELTSRMPDLLSKRKNSPSMRTVVKRFGTWAAFKQDATQEYQRQEIRREEKIASYISMIKKGELPRSYLELPENELLAAGAKYRVASRCMPGRTPQEVLKTIAKSGTFIHLVRSASGLNAGFIESEAVLIDVFDDIWPSAENLDSFTFDPEEIVQAALKHNAQERTRRARQTVNGSVPARGSGRGPDQNNEQPRATPYV